MNPIPNAMKAEFMSYMDAADDDDAPDGAWFQMLEDAAEAFMAKHKLRGHPNDAAHQYLMACAEIKKP